MNVKTSSRLLIAEVGAAHGIRGLVKLRVYCDDLGLIDEQDLFTHETDAATRHVVLERTNGPLTLARIDGTKDRTAAEKLRGIKFYIDRAALPETDENEYYHADLVGLTVHDENGAVIGTVQAIANFGASDLIDIKPPAGPSFYVPFTDDFVIGTDLTARILTIQDYKNFMPEPKQDTKDRHPGQSRQAATRDLQSLKKQKVPDMASPFRDDKGVE